MKYLFRWFWQKWFRFRERFLKRPSRLKTTYKTDLPDELRDNCIYVIGENAHFWFVCLLCPCDCGTLVKLSLLPNSKPRWTLVEHRDGTITLSPSIWRKDYCRSHYYIRHGFIEWV